MTLSCSREHEPVITSTVLIYLLFSKSTFITSISSISKFQSKSIKKTICHSGARRSSSSSSFRRERYRLNSSLLPCIWLSELFVSNAQFISGQNKALLFNPHTNNVILWNEMHKNQHPARFLILVSLATRSPLCK